MVYNEDGEEILLEDLENGASIKLEIINNEVVYIEVVSENDHKIIERYEGEITSIRINSITVVTGEEKKVFEVTEGTEIKLEGEEDLLSISDLVLGDEVKVTEVRLGELVAVTEIEIQEEEDLVELTEQFEGQITSISIDSVTIVLEEEEKVFEVTEETVIKLEGEEDLLSISDLALGDEVKVTKVTLGEVVTVTEIEIQEEEIVTTEYKGTVIATILLGDGYAITIETDDTERTFQVSDETTVVKEEVEMLFSDILIEDMVIITEETQGDEVSVIEIEILVEENEDDTV